MFKWFADLVTYDLLRMPKGAHISESLNFFLYDVPKIYFLLIVVVFFVAIIRTFLPPERIRKILSHEKELLGNILAALLGIFTPFCTCSAIPMFIGMLESGVPLGVTMSFLVSSPTVNEVALILLWGLFGWQVAVTYILSGLLIAVISGYIIGKLKLEKEIEDFVFKVKPVNADGENKLSVKDRLEYAVEYVREIFSQVWLYVMLGVGLGALIHGYVPVEFVTNYAGKGNPFAVIIAVIIGVPLYSNAAGTIPVVQALIGKGLQLGTTLAFMMAVTALSLPEFIILRKVLKPKLLLTFFGMVAVGIILIGYLFNFIYRAPETKLATTSPPALTLPKIAAQAPAKPAVKLAAKRSTKDIKDLETALKAGVPVIVKLGSDKCIPCRMMNPIIKELAVEQDGKAVFLSLDVYENRELAQKAGVMVIPTILFYDKRGKPKAKNDGGMSKEQLLNAIEEMELNK